MVRIIRKPSVLHVRFLYSPYIAVIQLQIAVKRFIADLIKLISNLSKFNQASVIGPLQLLRWPRKVQSPIHLPGTPLLERRNTLGMRSLTAAAVISVYWLKKSPKKMFCGSILRGYAMFIVVFVCSLIASQEVLLCYKFHQRKGRVTFLFFFFSNVTVIYSILMILFHTNWLQKIEALVVWISNKRCNVM